MATPLVLYSQEALERLPEEHRESVERDLALMGSSVHFDFMGDGAGLLHDRLIEETPWGEMQINGQTLARPGCFLGDQCADGEGAFGEGVPNREGAFGEGVCVPWLRCPSIEGQTIHPYTETVQAVRDKIEERFGECPNIVKAQIYADGGKVIASHADKILDLAEGSSIYDYRVGATRNFVMTHKETGFKAVVPMPNDCLFSIPYQINLRWRHGLVKEPGAGSSVSLILRESVTFKTPSGLLFGPRTLFPTRRQLEEASARRPTVGALEGGLPEVWSEEEMHRALVEAYGIENKNVVGLEIYQDIIRNTI